MRQHDDEPDTPGAHVDYGIYLLRGNGALPDLQGGISAHSNTCECRIVIGRRSDNQEVATGTLPCGDHEYLAQQISDALREEVLRPERMDDNLLNTCIEVLGDYMVMASATTEPQPGGSA